MFTSMPEYQQSLQLLRRELSIIACVGLLLLFVFSSLFINIWPLDQALILVLQSSIIWLYCIYQTSGLLQLNKLSENTVLYPQLGWANRLTIVRAWLIAVTAGFIFQPNLSDFILIFPAFSYFMAAVIDRLDGYVARICRQQSLLGDKLDTEFDAIGLLLVPILAVWIGQIHWSYLSVSLAYYLFKWGQYWRLRQGLSIHPLDKNPERRAIAGFQMGFLAVVLWPILAPPATVIAGIAFMIPLLIGFFIDWLTVSGRIGQNKPASQLYLKHCKVLIHAVLLPLFRLILFCLLTFTLFQKGLFAVNNGIASTELSISLLLVICAILILFGIGGRLFSLILCCLFSWLLLTYSMTASDVTILIFSIWVMQLGTGKYSLWIPDDRWVKRYDGAV